MAGGAALSEILSLHGGIKLKVFKHNIIHKDPIMKEPILCHSGSSLLADKLKRKSEKAKRASGVIFPLGSFCRKRSKLILI